MPGTHKQQTAWDAVTSSQFETFTFLAWTDSILPYLHLPCFYRWLERDFCRLLLQDRPGAVDRSNDQSRLSADRWVCTNLSLQVFRTVLVHRQRQAKVFSLSDTHTGKKLAYYCKNTLNSSSWDNMTDFFFYLCFELSKGSKIFSSSVSKSKTWWILYTWLILEHRFFQISSFFL